MSSTAPNASDGKDNDPAPSQDTAGEPEPNVAVKSDQEAEENSTPNKANSIQKVYPCLTNVSRNQQYVLLVVRS